MTLFAGFDVSNYQSAAQVAGALKTAKFLFVKASEGLTYVDPDHAAHVAAARKAGVPVGHYHFAHPANDAVREAQFFVSVAKPQPGDALALDLEADAGQPTNWVRRATYAAAFIVYVNAATHGRCVWYTNKSWLTGVLNAATLPQQGTLRGAPLWIATAGVAAGHPGIVQPWALHQYSTAGGIDHDVLAVPWSSFAIPKPTPVADVVTRRFAMLVFALGSDYLFATAFRHGVVTQDIAEARAAMARGEVVKVLGGPAATALGLTAGQHGNTQVIIGATFHDTAVAAAALMV